MARNTSVTDPRTVANVVTSLGGTIVPGQTLQFDLPLTQVGETVPKIRDVLGLGCRKVGERTAEHPEKLLCTQTVVTLELYRSS
jgi:hypothetical protein